MLATACVPSSGTMLARFLPAGEARETLIYLEDLDRIHARCRSSWRRWGAHRQHRPRDPQSAGLGVSGGGAAAEEKRSEMQARLIRIIGNNAQRIDRLVGDVLALGRRDEALPEAFRWRFRGRVHRGVRGGQGRPGRGVIVNRVGPEPQMAMDRTHLRQILWNLVGNARRHCSGQAAVIGRPCDDGRVALDVRRRPGMPACGPRSSNPFYHPFERDRPGAVHRPGAGRGQRRRARTVPTSGRLAAHFLIGRQTMTQTERRARSSGPDVLIVDDEDDIRELLELTCCAWAWPATARPAWPRPAACSARSATACA
jgi:hypothetical protein